jgi:hypothetical protein
LLDVESGTRIVREPDDSGKPIETVPDGDVERLAKDTIPLLRIRDHLRVSARNVQDDGVGGTGDHSAHLDVWEKNLSERKKKYRDLL